MATALKTTVAGLDPAFDVSALDALSHNYPSADLVHAAGAFLRDHSTPSELSARLAGPFEERVRWEITVGAGVIAIGTRSWGSVARREAHDSGVNVLDLGDAPAAASLAPAPGDEWAELERVCAALDAADPGPLPEVSESRRVRGWSAKSRSRMIRRLAELDYGPIIEAARPQAMVTLTLPANWLGTAPDGATFKSLLRALRWRYERAFGPWAAIWKLEFQRRGAPHIHMHCAPPFLAPKGWCPRGCDVVSEDHQHTFREWLAWTWATLCIPPAPWAWTPDAFADHLRVHLHPTVVDIREGQRCSDPRRLAVYFSKHGVFSAKDYQHDVPAEWGAAGPGRFWGYWHLERVVAVVEVQPVVAIAAARTIRRHSEASGQFSYKTVWRRKVDKTTGEIRVYPPGHSRAGEEWRVKRRVKVPVKRLRSGRGFAVLNDAPAFVSQLTRYLAMVETASRFAGELRNAGYSTDAISCSRCGQPLAGVLADYGRHVAACS